jgi:hypothetical protein
MKIPTLTNPKEAARILGRPESTLRYWRCAGVGPHWIKLEGRVLYDAGISWSILIEAVGFLPCAHTWRNTMALCRRGTVWHYDFWYHGRRFRGSTGQGLRSRAERVQAILIHEAKEKRSVLARTKIPRLAEFSRRFLDWVEASMLEPNSKRDYQYGWDMLQQTAVASLKLDEITRDSTDALRFSGSPAKTNVALRTLRRIYPKAWNGAT